EGGAARDEQQPPRRPLACAVPRWRERRAPGARDEPPRLESQRSLVHLVQHREYQRQGEREQREGVPAAHAGPGDPAMPTARKAQGKRAAVRRGRACSTEVTSAKVTALSPKSATKLPKKQAPSGGSPSARP